MKMIRMLMLALMMFSVPVNAANELKPKPNARVGSAEKPYQSSGSYKWYNTAEGDASGSVLDHVTVSAEQRGVNIEKPVTSLTIVDSTFTGLKPMKNSAYPAGIFAKAGTNLLVERTAIRGWVTIADGTYRQGDCFLAEWGFVGIVLRDVVLSGCTDGGYDGKARNVLLDRVTSSGNKISYRFWYNTVHATSIESVNPTEAHIQLNPRKDGKYGMGPAGIVADKISFLSTGKQALFDAGKGAIITVKECFIDVPAGTPFIKYREGGKASNVTLTLGKNCTRDAQGFAVNTPVEEPGVDLGQVLVDNGGDGIVTLKTASKIAEVNAYLKAQGSTIVLKKNSQVKQISGTRYLIVKP